MYLIGVKMARHIKIPLLLITIALVNSNVRAEPDPVGKWLMNEPLTLFDWGLYRADRQAELAANWIGEWFDLNYSGASVDYNWDLNEIHITLFATQQTDILIGHCDLYRKLFIKYLVTPIYWTPEEIAGIEFTSSDIYERLDEWFSHDGFKQLSRPEDLGEKLARIVWVGVDIISNFDSTSKIEKINCKERITVFEAPYKIRRDSK